MPLRVGGHSGERIWKMSIARWPSHWITGSPVHCSGLIIREIIGKRKVLIKNFTMFTV